MLTLSGFTQRPVAIGRDYNRCASWLQSLSLGPS